jgi:hypothetical protein
MLQLEHSRLRTSEGTCSDGYQGHGTPTGPVSPGSWLPSVDTKMQCGPAGDHHCRGGVGKRRMVPVSAYRAARSEGSFARLAAKTANPVQTSAPAWPFR